MFTIFQFYMLIIEKKSYNMALASVNLKTVCFWLTPTDFIQLSPWAPSVAKEVGAKGQVNINF